MLLVPVHGHDVELPERIINEIRKMHLDDVDSKHLSIIKTDDLITISRSHYTRRSFKSLFTSQINDPSLQNLIIEYIDTIAEKLDDAAESADLGVDLIDRAGIPVAASVTAASIVALAAVSTPLVPAIMLCGGIIGLGTCGIGRTIVKSFGNDRKKTANKLKQLSKELGGSP